MMTDATTTGTIVTSTDCDAPPPVTVILTVCGPATADVTSGTEKLHTFGSTVIDGGSEARAGFDDVRVNTAPADAVFVDRSAVMVTVDPPMIAPNTRNFAVISLVLGVTGEVGMVMLPWICIVTVRVIVPEVPVIVTAPEGAVGVIVVLNVAVILPEGTTTCVGSDKTEALDESLTT